MKIRKKAAKVSRAKPPLYLVGYRDLPPSLEDLKSWYDLHYGGPLSCLQREPGRPVSANHGPWHTQLLTSLPEADTSQWQGVLSWDHPAIGSVSPASAQPSTIADTHMSFSQSVWGCTGQA